MSEKMTRIRLPGYPGAGWMEWGEKTHEDMVKRIKTHALNNLNEARAILDANPDDFEVAVVRGPIVQHHVRKVLPGA